MTQLAFDFAASRLVPVGTLPIGAACKWGPWRYRVAKRDRWATVITATEPSAEGLTWSHGLLHEMAVEAIG